MAEHEERLACATWNIHRARGRDGALRPGRVAEALVRELAPGAEVLALTEADTDRPPHAGLLDLAALEAATGLRSAHGAARLRWGPRSHGFLGILVLLAPSLTVTSAQVLDLPGYCHRGAVALDLRRGQREVRVVATHLSLGQALRAVQMRAIGQYLRRARPMQTILLGDLNEWRPWGGLALSRRLVGVHLAGPARPTFPAVRPILPLDRILTTPGGCIRRARVLSSPALRMASDHLPLAGDVVLAPTQTAHRGR